MKILFMCVANSARSQLAEGLARTLLPKGFEIQSAGSVPTKVNPLAVESLSEIGIDISEQFSKSVEDLPPDFVSGLDVVVTLCAEEVCPVIVSQAKKLHWPLPDPAGHEGLNRNEQLEKFRSTRDSIKSMLIKFRSTLDQGSD